MYKYKCEKEYKMNLELPNFFDRYSNIIESNKKNVVHIKDVFDNSTFRYRTYNVLETMEKSKKYFVTAFLVEEINYLYNILDKIDLIILQRAKWSFELSNFIKEAKSKKKIIIYDMDDMIYNTKYVPQYLNSIGDYRDFIIDSFFALAKRYELIINECNGVITTTAPLAENINKDLNKQVWQLNNYLNKEQIKASKEVLELKKESYDNSKFVIGYFSGSNSHVRDLEVAESGILKLMNKYDNVYLKIVGYMDLGEEFKKLMKEKRLKFSKFVSYEELQYEIGKVDLNIIPLQRHEFNECKSELKYFEASIVNTLTLATNNSIYSDLIIDGEDGFLADELSWFEKLEYIYLNYSKLDKIKENANKKSHRLYDYNNQLDKIEKIYDDIILKLGD